ncbi:MAG: GIY-YIG nuclease family protein [Kiritimatiellales bacterium]|nr:GIY-YIG nuclease family protein [Kiritimatiellales bacterium]
MPGYPYILRSKSSDRYYIGSTIDPDSRLSRHNSNAVTSTKNKGPWKRVALSRVQVLRYCQESRDISETTEKPTDY